MNLSPFDDPQQRCFVMCNSEDYYSLWPEFCAIPLGWRVVFGPALHEQCAVWLKQHWLDIRPASLQQICR